MKKVIKAIIKVGLFFIGLFVILIAFIFVDQKIAESRASSFCNAAGSKQSVQEIKQLLEQTKGTGNVIFANESILVQFPQIFPEYYVCVVSLDENKKPIKSIVNHKD